jgi:hypothetical protein
LLDREKLSKKFSLIISKLFPDLHNESDLARKKWKEISQDKTFSHRAAVSQSSFLIPEWDGNLTNTFEIASPPCKQKYSLLAVDGSQIYPERHLSGAGCFLINTGGIFLRYGENSHAEIFSEPQIFLSSDFFQKDIPFSRELVDFKREECELGAIVKRAEQLDDKKNFFVFIDGSIIFWQLESKPPNVKKFFLNSYINFLEKLYQMRIPVAGYISMPKSRELVNLIKLGLCRFSVADCIACHREHTDFPCKKIDYLLDSHVIRFFSKRYKRTTVFYSRSKIVHSYPEQLRPAFVYCDVGSEIVRLELPTWVARDKDLLDKFCSIAVDQCEKGGGYPVCLAEAHEQAVVKGNDREFFYHLLRKVGIEEHKKINFSPKAIKKRGIGI